MKVKTYGIMGLNEWYGVVKAGTLTAKVSFKGGSAMPSGSLPAYYVTRDPIVQFIIENSKEYKSGFIKLMMVQEVRGVHRHEAVPKQRAAEADGGKAGAAGVQTVEVQTVEVASKADAVEWLKERYPDKGYNSFNLRGKEAFAAACADCGVVFEIKAV